MRKELISELEQDIIRSEIAIHSLADHSNVIKYIESYEDSKYIFILMECLKDAVELQSELLNRKKKYFEESPNLLFKEEEVRCIMK